MDARGLPRPLQLALLTIVALALGCGDEGPTSAEPLSPEDADIGPPPAGFVVIDGRHSEGVPGFFFLPPLAGAPDLDGQILDPTLEDVAVEICEGTTGSGDCTGLVSRFERRDGPGSPFGRVVVDDEGYRTMWRPRDSDVRVGEPYHLRVVVGAQLLGEMDIAFWRTPRERSAIDLESTRAIPLNGVVSIRFWISEGAVPDGPPDLTVSAVTPASPEVRAGDVLDVEATVENAGEGEAGPSDARFVAEDAAEGTEVASEVVPVGPLTPGTSARPAASFQTDGSWPASVRVRVVADAAKSVDEADESNNEALSDVVPITRPDLFAAELAVPSSVDVGAPLPVAVTVSNGGTAVAEEFDVLLRVLTSSGEPLAAATIRVGPLSPGESGVAAEEFDSEASWLPAVQVEVTVDASDEVLEADESNNGASAGVGLDVANLRIDAVRTPDAVPAAGGSLEVEADVLNDGAAAAVDVGVLIRVLSVGEGSEVASHAAAPIAVAAGEAEAVSHAFTADPSWPDAVVVHVIVDEADAVLESDESDNSGTSGEVSITRANLLVADVRVPASVPVGGELAVEADVHNDGAAPAGATDLRVRVLSADDGSELASSTLAQASLGSGGTLTLTVSFTAGAAWPGSVVVDVTTDPDDAIPESDESDNGAVSAPVAVTVPDLTVTAAAFSAPSVVLQCTVDVLVTVRNEGNGDAPSTDLRISLRDAGTGDEFTGRSIAQPGLAPGEETRIVETFTAADGWPAAVALHAETDASGGVPESDEGDNGLSGSEEARALVAPPAGFTKLWICGASDSWGGADNWRPVGVPAATDDVFVPAGTPFTPRLVTHTEVRDITIEDGSSLTHNGLMLTASGSVAAPGPMLSPGTLRMTGAGVTLEGRVPVLDFQATATLSGPTDIGGQATLARGSRLVVGGQRLETASSMVVDFDDGRTDGLIMTDPGDEVTVGGTFLMRGWPETADTEGSFAAGVLRLRGDLHALAVNGPRSHRAFVSTGTVVRMEGSARQQLVLGNESRVHDIFIDNGSADGVVLARGMHVFGQLTMVGSSRLLSPQDQRAFYRNRLPVTGPGYEVGNSHVTGDIAMERDVTIPNNRNLRVDRGARLTVSGHRLDVGGALVVDFDDGRTDGLIMTDPDDEVIIGGLFRPRGWPETADTEGSFTAGVLRVRGDLNALAVNGPRSHRAFVSTGTVVRMEGSARQQLVLGNESRVHDIFIDNGSADGVVLGTGTHVFGQLTMVGSSRLSNPQDQRIYYRNLLPITGPGYEVVNSHVTGDITMERDAAIPNGRNLRVDRGARLTVNGHRLDVGGSLVAEFDDGRADGLVMTDPGDEVLVRRDLVLRGMPAEADTEGSFTDGVLRLLGGLHSLPVNGALSHRAFVSTGTVVRMEGSARQQLVLGNESRVHDIFIDNGSADGVVLGTGTHVFGQLTMVGSSRLSNPQDQRIHYHRHFPITGPGYDVDQSWIVGEFALERAASLPNPTNLLMIEQGGRLSLAGHRLELAGNLMVRLYTPGHEGIVMRSGDVLVVEGDLDYQGRGGRTTDHLAGGTMLLRGDFTHVAVTAGTSREVFVSTGTTVVFDGDGTPQVIAGHTPQKYDGEGRVIAGSRFVDMVIAEGALVEFGRTSFASTSEIWVEGVADWAGRIDREDSNLGTWLVISTLILRPTLDGFSNAPICYGTLVQEGGIIGHTTTREGWAPLQALGSDDCRRD